MIQLSRDPLTWSTKTFQCVMKYPAKFGVYGPHGKGNIAIFKSHLIPRDQKIKRS